jgi:hypothetical protein
MSTMTQRLVTLNGIAPAQMLKGDLVKLVEEAPVLATGPAERFRTGMIYGLGSGLPLLSLALSKLGGSLLLTGHWPLGLFAFALMGAVLAVSLPHLAWSLVHLTGSDQRPAWCLAVALDLSLILTELVGVYATGLGLGLVCFAVMFAVAVASALLNIHAFFNAHK